MRFNRVTAFSKKAIIDWASRHLANASEVVTDGLLGFEDLGDAGFSHKVIITGGDPECVKIADFK